MFHHLPSVTPKQLCALAHLGYTLEGGISYDLLSPYKKVLNLAMCSLQCSTITALADKMARALAAAEHY